MPLTFDFKQSVDEVRNILTDPDFLVERNLTLGDIESDCEVEEDEDEIIVRMSRKMPVEMNALLAKIFDPIQQLNMVETWHRDGDNWEGEYEIKNKGQPVTLSASFSLKAKGKGSRYEITHRCKAKVPLIGGKIEKACLAQTPDGAKKELEYAKQKLG